MPVYPAGCKLALDCMLGLVDPPTLQGRLHTASPPTAENQLTAAAAPGYAPLDLAPGAATWASSADADSGDADNVGALLYPANTHASNPWPVTPVLGLWNGETLVASAALDVGAPGPGRQLRIPAGALDWSIPAAA